MPGIGQKVDSTSTTEKMQSAQWSVHFWLAAERRIAVARGESRSDPVQGCDDRDFTRSLFETIWHVDQERKPRLVDLVERHASGREYHHITRLDQLDHLATTG